MPSLIDSRIVPLSEVKPNTYNPKKHYDSTPEGRNQFARVFKSMQKNQQIEPILVRELKDGSFEIVNGFHRYEAAKKLGWVDIWVNNLGKISSQKAKTIAIATEDAKIPLDRIEVAKLVSEIMGDPSMMDELVYTDEEIKQMQDMLKFNWDEYESKEGDVETEELTSEEDDQYTVVIPSDKLETWEILKKKLKIKNDSELLVLLIDDKLADYA